jgi:hypothetical protein
MSRDVTDAARDRGLQVCTSRCSCSLWSGRPEDSAVGGCMMPRATPRGISLLTISAWRTCNEVVGSGKGLLITLPLGDGRDQTHAGQLLKDHALPDQASRCTTRSDWLWGVKFQHQVARGLSSDIQHAVRRAPSLAVGRLPPRCRAGCQNFTRGQKLT